jgi:hypothetical protein
MLIRPTTHKNYECPAIMLLQEHIISGRKNTSNKLFTRQYKSLKVIGGL